MSARYSHTPYKPSNVANNSNEDIYENRPVNREPARKVSSSQEHHIFASSVNSPTKPRAPSATQSPENRQFDRQNRQSCQRQLASTTATNSAGNANAETYEEVEILSRFPELGSPTVQNNSPVNGYKQWIKRINALITISILLALFSCIVATTVLVKQVNFQIPDENVQNEQPQFSTAAMLTLNPNTQTTMQKVPESCLDHKAEGQNRSGIFLIRPDQNSSLFPTFCDMTSGGGGWTLVASVHENNIDGKCTVGDKWSSEQGIEPSTLEVPGNWASLDLFGHIEAVTSADYKNPAYYNLEANDIMLWHVQNQVEINDLEEKAFLKYFTTNGFLDGMTLRDYFSGNATLDPILWPIVSLNNTVLLERLQEQIPDFYSYQYDAQPPTQIQDGGGDMYDGGNRVSFQVNDEDRIQVTYGEVYGRPISGYWARSEAVHPFIFLAWIDGHNVDSFAIRVTSDVGADGTGLWTTYANTFQRDGFTIGYRAFHIYDAGDPSICEVYFYISNLAKWNSVAPSVTYPLWSSGTQTLLNEMRLQGSRYIFAGYTLLSRTAGGRITNSQVVAVLQEMKRFVEGVEVLPFSPPPTIAQPIEFAKGNLSDITSRVPLSQVSYTTPGYIEFRSFDSYGFPHALCPGVRMENRSDPSLHCIGGVNSNKYGRNPTCGDFSDWNRGGNTRIDRPTVTGRSLQDIQSTILIFTRSNATFLLIGNSTGN